MTTMPVAVNLMGTQERVLWSMGMERPEELEALGERRGRIYVRTARLMELDARIRARRPAKAQDDPFILASEAIAQRRR